MLEPEPRYRLKSKADDEDELREAKEYDELLDELLELKEKEERLLEDDELRELKEYEERLLGDDEKPLELPAENDVPPPEEADEDADPPKNVPEHPRRGSMQGGSVSKSKGGESK